MNLSVFGSFGAASRARSGSGAPRDTKHVLKSQGKKPMVVDRQPAATATPRCEQFEACLGTNPSWAKRGECCGKFRDDTRAQKYGCWMQNNNNADDGGYLVSACELLFAWYDEDYAFERELGGNAFATEYISKEDLKAACHGWCDANGAAGGAWCTYKNMSDCLANPDKVGTGWGECCGRYPSAWDHANWSEHCSLTGTAESMTECLEYDATECKESIVSGFTFKGHCEVKTGAREDDCRAFCDSAKALPGRTPDAAVNYGYQSFYYERQCLALPELRNCLADGDLGTCCAVHSRAKDLIEECNQLSRNCSAAPTSDLQCQKYCKAAGSIGLSSPFCASIEYDECQKEGSEARGKCCALVPTIQPPTPSPICTLIAKDAFYVCGYGYGYTVRTASEDITVCYHRDGRTAEDCVPYVNGQGQYPLRSDFVDPPYYCSFNHILEQTTEENPPSTTPAPLRSVCNKYLTTGKVDCDLDTSEDEVKKICTEWCDNIGQNIYYASGCTPAADRAFEKCVYGDPGPRYGAQDEDDGRDGYNPSRSRWLGSLAALVTRSETWWSCCGENPTASECITAIRNCAAVYGSDWEAQRDALEDGLDDYDEVTDYFQEAIDSADNACRALCSGYEDEPDWCGNVPGRSLGSGDIAAIVLGVVCFLLIGGVVALLILRWKKPGVAAEASPV